MDMNIQITIARVCIAELERQAGASDQGPNVAAGARGFLAPDGRTAPDERVRVIEGALAGGP